MQVRMTEAREASIDGTTVTRYEAGEVYDVPEDLAARWITRGHAEQAGTPTPTPTAAPDGEKAAGAAPENRSRGAAPDDKTRGRSRRRTGGR